MLVLATCALFGRLATGSRLQYLALYPDLFQSKSAEPDQSEPERDLADNAESLAGSLAQVNLGGVGLQNYDEATEYEVNSEGDNGVTPVTNTAAKADVDTIDFKANSMSKGKELLAELGASVAPSIDHPAGEEIDDASLRVDVTSGPSLQTELTAAEDAADELYIASRLQDDAMMKLKEYAPDILATATTSALQDADLQVDIEKKNTDFLPGVQKMTSNQHLPHLGNTVPSLIQAQASLQTPHHSGDPFSTNVNAFSWNYFSSVPSPVFAIFIVAALVMLVSRFVDSSRFCLSRPFTCSFLKSEIRQQHFHHGCVVYEWSQTFKTVTIYFRPPEGQLAGDLDIKVSSRQLQVGRRGRHSYLKEETYDVVNAEMSSWSLEPDGELKVVLRKVRKSRWPVALLHSSKSFAGAAVQSDAMKSTLKPIEVI